MTTSGMAVNRRRCPGAELLTSEQFGERVPVNRVHTVRDMCRRRVVPGASRVGHDWRIHWPTFYAALAGPGVEAGRIVTAGRLAGKLGISQRALRRATAAPGTPGKFPGLQMGKNGPWWYALPAVQPLVPWPLDDDAAPAAPDAGRLRRGRRR